MLKKIIQTGGGILSAGVIGLAMYCWTPGGPGPDLEAFKDKAAQYDVRIIRDKWGVPHIYGARDTDAGFGLAYAHAEDDWKTIEETILFVRGDLSRHQGKSAGVTDYLMDLLKVEETVAAKYESDLSEETRALLEGYADGINLWAAENSDQVLPGVLPVSSQDIVAGFVARTPFFFGFDADLEKLFAESRALPVSERKLAGFIADDTPAPLIGSNAFAVAPARSDDGHTRLLVNSHQPFTGPVAWYEARIKTEEGWDMIGSLFPGTPLILHGTSPDLGWAHTVNKPDLLDIYVLETDNDKNPTRYKLSGEWHELERTTSTFRAKLFWNFSWPVKRDVLWSKHGPVLVTKHGIYAVRYAGLGDIQAVEQWYQMNRASNFEEWRAALDIRGIPSFNIIYADKAGNIGYFYNATMPDRQQGWEWRQYLPGDITDTLWQDYVPLDDLPHLVNPASGWVFNANHTPYQSSDAAHDIKAEDFPASFGIETHLTNRAMRALAAYEPDTQISEEEFLAYRADHYYAEGSNARILVAGLVSADFSGDDDLQAAQQVLAGWDGSAGIESKSAALAILTTVKAKGYLMNGEEMAPEDALRETAAKLKATYGRLDPEWGEVNRLVRGDISLPVNGGPDTLRALYAQDTIDEIGTLTATGGDTYILYADWFPEGELSVQTIHQFGSATLDETSPHYADQAPLFAAEEYKPMPMTLEAVLAEATRDYRPGR